VDARRAEDGRVDRAIWVVVAAKLFVQLAYANGYGWFRDELYYLACARRLAWGYVDHPPFSIALLKLETAIFGESRFAVRLAPAIAGALLVWLAARIAREMGGARVAQVIAAVAVLACPEYLALDHFYSMNALELVLWAGAACVVARVLRGGATRRAWIALGVVLGLGMLNKTSVLWLVGGIAVGLVATKERRLLASAGPWIALAIMTAIFAPHVAWQIENGWPTREWMKMAMEHKMIAVSPLAFLSAQVLDMNPLSAPLWIAGLAALLAWRPLERWRALGVAYVAVLALLLASQRVRPGYLAPAYPMLFAAGGVVAERVARWIAAAYGAALVASGAAIAPLALPILPAPTYVAYARALGQTPSTTEKKEMGVLPQFFADMFGWEELAAAVEKAAATLAPDERRDAVVFAGNYGEAGALEKFGSVPVVCGHNNYWLWGAHGASGRVVILVGADEGAILERYDRADYVTTFEHPYVMPYENHLKIFVARDRKEPLAPSWSKLKHYD